MTSTNWDHSKLMSSSSLDAGLGINDLQRGVENSLSLLHSRSAIVHSQSASFSQDSQLLTDQSGMGGIASNDLSEDDFLAIIEIITRQTDQAGNTPNTARALGVLTGNQVYQDWIGESDPNDYYRFSLDQRSTFKLSLTNLAADADVQLLSSNGSVIQNSRSSGTTSESISITLETGTYYIRVYPDSGSTLYTLNLSSSSTAPISEPVSDWYRQNLRDSGLISLTRELAADGQLDRNDMIAIFRNTRDGGSIDANELGDLKTILNNRSRFSLADYVYNLSNKLVNGDRANVTTGIGNLVAGSREAQMERLIGKWFLGNDLPNTEYTYQYAEGALFQNGVNYQDVRQGKVGDCYLMAALSATAYHTPSAIRDMFIDNRDGTFTVRFFTDRGADYVTVNRYLPTMADGQLVYARPDQNYRNASNELWVALAEKAYVQINESAGIAQDGSKAYVGIDSGRPDDATRHIIGRNATLSNIFDTRTIVNAFEQGNPVTMLTFDRGVASSIVADHVYVMLGYNTTNSTFRLYNPWGIGANAQKPGIVELTLSQLRSNFEGWSYTTA